MHPEQGSDPQSVQPGGQPVTLAEHVPGASVWVRSDPLLQSPDEKPAQPVHVPGGFEQSICPFLHSLFKAEVQYTSEPN